jgi:hypothetical protein
LLTLSQSTQIHQGLMTSFLDKKSIYQDSLTTGAVLALVKNDEKYTDSFTFAIEDKTQVCQSELAEPKQNLDKRLSEVQVAYGTL